MMIKPKVSVVKCINYQPALVQAAVKKAVDLAGGITAFIKPGSKVLLKPNLLMALPPESAVTTHPEVVRAAVKILKEIGCKIYLGDSPSVWGKQRENVDFVYRETGMSRLAEEENIELVKFAKRRWRGKFPLAEWLDSCDYLVSVPKFKTHGLTVLTGAVKNLFGLVTDTYKTELHKNYFLPEDFAKILVDIYVETKPALTIIDAIVALEGEGPGTGGEKRDTGLVLAGADCLALDTVLAVIMGVKPLAVSTNKEARARGLGVTDIDAIEIIVENLKEIIAKPFKLPAVSATRKIPRPLIELARKFIRYYPELDYKKCILCGACVEVCPLKIIKSQEGRIVIDYAKCIACFCCQESCPHAAIKLKKSLLAKMVGL